MGTSARRPRGFGYFGATVLAAVALSPVAAHSENSTWIGPGNNFNSPLNWTAGVPGTGDTAIFTASGTTSIAVLANTALSQFQFNLGASAYSFTVDGTILTVNGVGIINNSSNAPTITSNGTVAFNNASTAGNAIINVNAGLLAFNNTSTAGNSTIQVFNGGRVQFSGNASGGTAQIINNGGTVDISQSSGLSVGSIARSGSFTLGGQQLTVGSNNLSTTVSGTISGSGGSLVKQGSGTLTLTGTNTYTGGTTVSAGTLSTSADPNLGAGGLTFNGGTLETTASFTSTRSVRLNSTGTFQVDTGTLTLDGVIDGPGTLVKTGPGTLTLGGANSYPGATTISAGTLVLQGSLASGVVTQPGGTFINHGTVGGSLANAGSTTNMS